MNHDFYDVKPMALMKAQSRKVIYGCVLVGAYYWMPSMEKECPESRIIEVIDDKWNGYSITPEMLYGPHFDWGEMCEVRDSAYDEWVVQPFHCYAANGRDGDPTIYAGNGCWFQIRRIPKPGNKLDKAKLLKDALEEVEKQFKAFAEIPPETGTEGE